jgi:hypothetical protein
MADGHRNTDTGIQPIILPGIPQYMCTYIVLVYIHVQIHSHTVRAHHTTCTIAEIKDSLQLGLVVALLTPNVDVGDADDDAAHRSGLDAALHEPEERDRARHLGPRLELHLAGEHVRDEAPDPGGRHDPVGLHRHVHPNGGRAPARHGPGRDLAVAHGRAAVVERRGGGAVAERGRVRVPHADHEEERDVELHGDGGERDDAREDARGVDREELRDGVPRAEDREQGDGGRRGDEEQGEGGEGEAEEDAAAADFLGAVVLGRHAAGLGHVW